MHVTPKTFYFCFPSCCLVLICISLQVGNLQEYFNAVAVSNKLIMFGSQKCVVLS